MAENYRRAAQQQENLNRSIRNGTTAADGMLGKVKDVVTTLAAGVELQKTFNLSDILASGTARLTLLGMTVVLWQLWSKPKQGI